MKQTGTKTGNLQRKENAADEQLDTIRNVSNTTSASQGKCYLIYSGINNPERVKSANDGQHPHHQKKNTVP